MQIYEVTDPLFKEYGKIIDSVELTELLAEMKHTPVPEDVVYVASEPKLEALAVMKELTDKTYGELPIQIGYCNGHNRKLNALEYHRSRISQRSLPMTPRKSKHSGFLPGQR